MPWRAFPSAERSRRLRGGRSCDPFAARGIPGPPTATGSDSVKNERLLLAGKGGDGWRL